MCDTYPSNFAPPLAKLKPVLHTGACNFPSGSSGLSFSCVTRGSWFKNAPFQAAFPSLSCFLISLPCFLHFPHQLLVCKSLSQHLLGEPQIRQLGKEQWTYFFTPELSRNFNIQMCFATFQEGDTLYSISQIFDYKTVSPFSPQISLETNIPSKVVWETVSLICWWKCCQCPHFTGKRTNPRRVKGLSEVSQLALADLYLRI